MVKELSCRKFRFFEHSSAAGCPFQNFLFDLCKLNLPALVIHGDDDKIIPFGDAGVLSARLLKKSPLKIYKGFQQGMCTTEADTINADLPAFIKS